jgi:hypothetical protein
MPGRGDCSARAVSTPWSATCTAATASASRAPTNRTATSGTATPPRLPAPARPACHRLLRHFRSFAPGTVRRRPPSLDYGPVSRGVQRQDGNRM